MKKLLISSMLLLAVACKREQRVGPPAQTEQSQGSPANAPPGSSDNQQEIKWVHGRVSDEHGRPIANAVVHGLALDYDGPPFQMVRMHEYAKQAVTDQNGYYELKDLDSWMSLTLLATAPGRAPAWAWIDEVGLMDDRPSTVEDFVLSSQTGKLDVTVLQEGKPVRGANVAAYLKNAPLQKEWAVPTSDDNTIEDAAHPAAVTNADGVAHFDNLVPGSYQLVVQLCFVCADAPEAFAHGIAVQTGETTKFTLAIYPQYLLPPFVVHRADGTPLTGDNAALNFGPVDSLINTKGLSYLNLDHSGKGHAWVERPGLWRIEVTFPKSPTKSISTRDQYYAVGHVAASPSLRVTPRPVITAMPFNENASVNVQVLDEHGKPLHAKVQMVQPLMGGYEGWTDSEGRVRFEQVTPGDRYIIRAVSYGREPLPSDDYSPLADPSKLANRLEILPQYVAVAANQERNFVLKKELVGYLYGTVKNAAGQDDLPYLRIVSPARFPDENSLEGFENFGNGEYLAGAFQAGAVEVWLANDDPNGQAWAEIRTTLQPGEARRVNLEPARWKPFRSLTHKSYLRSEPDSPPMEELEPAYLRQELGPAYLNGTVVMHDGRTPAFGAQVFYFEPGRADPTLIAMADAIGNLHSRDVPEENAPRRPAGLADQKTGPDSPVLIASLPGKCGATIQPVTELGDAPLHLMLPQPLLLSGNVNVDRSVLRPGTGSIRVIAAYQGDSFLASWLTMETTADAGGNFALKGLSPGTYQIQAALDEIWLSPPVTVAVSDRNPEPVHLAIPAPGAALRIRLRGENNKPVAKAAITIDREGPLSGLWPHEWVSDETGVIFVPTLESGKHTIRGKRLSRLEVVEVPPARTATPVDLVMTLR